MNKNTDYIIDENNMLVEYIGKGGDIIIPDGIEDLLFNSFLVYNLTSIVIPGSIKDITSNIFHDQPSLKKVILKEGVTSISFLSFHNCPSLEEIYLPKSLNHLDYNAFCECSSFKKIYYSGNKEQWDNIQKEDGWIDDNRYEIIYNFPNE